MNLLEVMAQLEAGGWHYRLSSRVSTTGLYGATVWRDDVLGSSRVCHRHAPGEALLAALESAQELRAERQAHRDARAAGSAA